VSVHERLELQFAFTAHDPRSFGLFGLRCVRMIRKDSLYLAFRYIHCRSTALVCAKGSPSISDQ
jgi:hypothetical protein